MAERRFSQNRKIRDEASRVCEAYAPWWLGIYSGAEDEDCEVVFWIQKVGVRDGAKFVPRGAGDIVCDAYQDDERRVGADVKGTLATLDIVGRRRDHHMLGQGPHQAPGAYGLDGPVFVQDCHKHSREDGDMGGA